MKTKASSRAGVSLAEVMIAMLLFALGMIGIFSVSTTMRSMSMLTNSVSEATLLGTSTIESFRAFNPAQLTSSNRVIGAYTISWTVATNAGCQARQVRVNVAWTDLRSRAHAVSVNSILEQ